MTTTWPDSHLTPLTASCDHMTSWLSEWKLDHAFQITPLKEWMRLPLGPFSLLIGWYVDMTAGARAALLTTKWKLCVEHSTATGEKDSESLKLWSFHDSPGVCMQGLYVREIHVYNKMSTISMSTGSNLLFSDEETEARETKRGVHGHTAIPSTVH